MVPFNHHHHYQWRMITHRLEVLAEGGLGDNPVLSRPVEISKIGAPTTACPCSRAKRPGPRRTAARRRPCGPTTADRGSGKVGSSRGCAPRRFESGAGLALRGSPTLIGVRSHPYRGMGRWPQRRQKVGKKCPNKPPFRFSVGVKPRPSRARASRESVSNSFHAEPLQYVSLPL